MQYIKFFFYCKVCLSARSLSQTSVEGKNLLECDSEKESLKFHFFYMFGDYSEIKDVIQQYLAFLVLLQLHPLIS